LIFLSITLVWDEIHHHRRRSHINHGKTALVPTFTTVLWHGWSLCTKIR
jgi:hypothetical protein